MESDEQVAENVADKRVEMMETESIVQDMLTSSKSKEDSMNSNRSLNEDADIDSLCVVPSNDISDATATKECDIPKNDTTQPSRCEGENVMESETLRAESGFAKSQINPNVRIKMLARVALSDAHFKHQQMGEPELTMDEKIDIAQVMLDANKATFLARFGDFLELEDLEYFQDCRHIYEVDFYVKQIMKRKSGNFERNRVKNRRYEAMKDLTMKGDYFSEDEMKFRDPYLYEQMVGQYLTDEEIQAKIDKSDLRFSTILIHHIDQLDENSRFYRDKDKEEGQEEEEEDDEEDVPDAEESEMEDEEDSAKKDAKPKISEEKKKELKTEFLTLMQEQFLRGEDKQFDYSKVDNNEAYDDLTVLNHDAEEKYFDDDDDNDEESIHSDCG